MRGARNPDARPIRLLKHRRNVMRLQSSAARNGEERFPFICLPEPPWNMTITFTPAEEGEWAEGGEPQHPGSPCHLSPDLGEQAPWAGDDYSGGFLPIVFNGCI